MFRSLVSGLVLLSSVVVPTAGGLEASGQGLSGRVVVQPPFPVVVSGVTSGGSGCLPGSVTVQAQPDGSGVRVRYSDYGVQSGGNASPVAGRRNCQVSLLVHVPSGFTYAVDEVEHRGLASLASGVRGLMRSAVSFAGMKQSNIYSHSVLGPLDGPWNVMDIPELPSLQFMPCGQERVLNLLTELRITSPGISADRSSSLELTSPEGTFSSDYTFTWKECS